MPYTPLKKQPKGLQEGEIALHLDSVNEPVAVRVTHEAAENGHGVVFTCRARWIDEKGNDAHERGTVEFTHKANANEMLAFGVDGISREMLHAILNEEPTLDETGHPIIPWAAGFRDHNVCNAIFGARHTGTADLMKALALK